MERCFMGLEGQPKIQRYNWAGSIFHVHMQKLFSIRNFHVSIPTSDSWSAFPFLSLLHPLPEAMLISLCQKGVSFGKDKLIWHLVAVTETTFQDLLVPGLISPELFLQPLFSLTSQFRPYFLLLQWNSMVFPPLPLPQKLFPICRYRVCHFFPSG